MSPPSPPSPPATAAVPADTITTLQQYTACDVSDALLKLNVPKAGFIADLVQYSPGSQPATATTTTTTVVAAPVSTVLFAARNPDHRPADLPAPNFSSSAHWVDLAVPETIAFLQQPPGQTNAVCGGIMALRMKMLGLHGVVVAGRVRDVEELRSTQLSIWAHATSTVGSAGSAIPWAQQVPLTVDDVPVHPGDIAVCDALNGVVVIPRRLLAHVLDMLPRLVAADDKAKADVARGVSVKEAFARHRG